MIGVPYAATKWDEIVPGLFVGGHDYRPSLGVRDVKVDDEFDLVISLYQRSSDRHGPAPDVEHIVHGIPDGHLSQAEVATVRGLADLAVEAIMAGARVLVRCQAGYNRSALVAALALVQMGRTGEQAIALIRKQRSSWALFNEHFQALILAGRQLEVCGA